MGDDLFLEELDHQGWPNSKERLGAQRTGGRGGTQR